MSEIIQRELFENGEIVGYEYGGRLVRCKDCRWFENDGFHTNCKIMRFCVEAEDYCSRGERKENET